MAADLNEAGFSTLTTGLTVTRLCATSFILQVYDVWRRTGVAWCPESIAARLLPLELSLTKYCSLRDETWR